MNTNFDLLTLLRRSNLRHVQEAADKIERQENLIEYWKARAEGRTPLHHCPTCTCTVESADSAGEKHGSGG